MIYCFKRFLNYHFLLHTSEILLNCFWFCFLSFYSNQFLLYFVTFCDANNVEKILHFYLCVYIQVMSVRRVSLIFVLIRLFERLVLSATLYIHNNIFVEFEFHDTACVIYSDLAYTWPCRWMSPTTQAHN